MSNTGISALRVTERPRCAGPGRRGAGALPARGAPRPAAGQLPSAAVCRPAGGAGPGSRRPGLVHRRPRPARQPARRARARRPGAVPGKIRQAAESIGAAWQWLAGSSPASAADAMTPGPDGVLREAVHRAVTAWSRPAATGQDRDEVIEGAMGAVHASRQPPGTSPGERPGCAPAGSATRRASLEAAGEQLREALACSQAASRARHGQRDAAATRDVRGGGGERVPRPRRATPEQAARRPRQHPGSRDSAAGKIARETAYLQNPRTAGTPRMAA